MREDRKRAIRVLAVDDSAVMRGVLRTLELVREAREILP